MTEAASPDDVPDTGMPGDALMRAKGIEGGWGGVAGGDGIADVMLGLPVEHWHLLMQEGWQQLGLPGAEQPLPWPSPWRQHLCGGGVDLLLEQG